MVFRVTPSLPTETVKIDQTVYVLMYGYYISHSLTLQMATIGKCEKNKNLKKCFTLDSRGDGVLRVQLVAMHCLWQCHITRQRALAIKITRKPATCSFGVTET